MVHTVNVTDRSPKAIVRELLRIGAGPRDMAGMNAVLNDWLNSRTPAFDTFLSYCRGKTWPNVQVLSLLEYQCCYLFYTEGDGDEDWLDVKEYEGMWHIFQPIIRDQNLLNVEEIARVLLNVIIPLPTARTRSQALEV